MILNTSRGILILKSLERFQDRSVGGLNAEKMRFAHKFAEIETLEKIVEAVSPDVLIGELLVTTC